MIDLSTLATFAAVVLGLFLIPGPAVLMTLGRAASGAAMTAVGTIYMLSAPAWPCRNADLTAL